MRKNELQSAAATSAATLSTSVPRRIAPLICGLLIAKTRSTIAQEGKDNANECYTFERSCDPSYGW